MAHQVLQTTDITVLRLADGMQVAFTVQLIEDDDVREQIQVSVVVDKSYGDSVGDIYTAAIARATRLLNPPA